MKGEACSRLSGGQNSMETMGGLPQTPMGTPSTHDRVHGRVSRICKEGSQLDRTKLYPPPPQRVERPPLPSEQNGNSHPNMISKYDASYSFYIFFVFWGQHLRHMEVLRLGVKLEMQLPPTPQLTATLDP